jgi:Cryptococcal mannosyltransferase 1
MAKLWRSQEYELLDPRRASSDSSQFGSSSDRDFENDSTRRFDSQTISSPSWGSWPLRLALQTCSRLRRGRRRRSRKPRRQCLYWTIWTLAAIPWILVFLVYFTAVFVPSYTNWPEHYQVLEKRCRDSKEPGRGNPNNEKVIIAASIYDHDGTLLAGQWGDAVVELVQLLGPENVHLSIYENDPNEAAKSSLAKLGSQLKCKCSETPVQK